MATREIKLGTPADPPRVGIAVARFNQFITGQLLQGAGDALARHGIPDENILIAWVPGSFELPLAADLLLDAGRCHGVVALGAVIRGSTPHFDYVADNCARGLAEVALKRERPVAFGVLTTDTVEQALERAGTADGNKGFDAAMSVLNMIHLAQAVRDGEAGDA